MNTDTHRLLIRGQSQGDSDGRNSPNTNDGRDNAESELKYMEELRRSSQEEITIKMGQPQVREVRVTSSINKLRSQSVGVGNETQTLEDPLMSDTYMQQMHQLLKAAVTSPSPESLDQEVVNDKDQGLA